MATRLTIKRDGGSHWLVTSGASEKPVALFYGHNVSDQVARKRAARFVDSMSRAEKEIR